MKLTKMKLTQMKLTEIKLTEMKLTEIKLTKIKFHFKISYSNDILKSSSKANPTTLLIIK